MKKEIKLIEMRCQALQYLINSIGEIMHDLKDELRPETIERMEDTITDLEFEITRSHEVLMQLIK